MRCVGARKNSAPDTISEFTSLKDLEPTNIYLQTKTFD